MTFKILVTGCAGFIGSHLSEKLLSNGFTIYGIDNFDAFYDKEIKLNNLKKSLSHPNFKFQELDIRNLDSLIAIPDTDIDAVIHLAAKAGVLPSIINQDEYIHTNIIGTKNILEFMKVQKIKKMIFGSSSSIYGNSRKIPFSESNNVDQPISPYAFTKKSCELLNFTYHHLYDFSIINLRFFTVYGPRQRPDLAIHKFVKQIINNQPIILYGDGNTARDYTYIDDVVEGISLALDYLKNNHCYEIINIGNNSPITLNTLTEYLFEILKKPKNTIKKPLPDGDVMLTYADINKAKKILNYQPKVGFEQGLKFFVEWLKHEPRAEIHK